MAEQAVRQPDRAGDRAAEAPPRSRGGGAAASAVTNGGVRGGALRSARASTPPRKRDHVLPWVALLAVLAVAAVPLLVELGRPDVVTEREARSVATSMHSWHNLTRVDEAYRGLLPPTPRYNSEPVTDRPPGGTWLHLLAYQRLEGRAPTVDDFIYHARVASAAAALLTIAAVFWAGMSIGGLTTAVLSAMVCVSLPLLLLEGRLGTSAMPQVAAGMCAIASALWAARPLKPSPALVRQALGWAVCGASLGAAVLIGGIALAPKVLLPLIVILALCPKRIGYLLALTAACSIAVLMVLPWALHIHESQPGAWQAWLGQLAPDGWASAGALVSWLGAVVTWGPLLLLPWTLWLVGGLFQPFSTSSVGSRQRMFIGWAWFMTLSLLLLLAPPGREPAHALLLIPAGAFVVGQVMRQFTDLSSEGRHARFWRAARYPHVGLLLAASVAGPMMLSGQADLVRDGWLSRPIVQPMPWLYWTGASLALLGIAGLSLRYAIRHYPDRAVVCWAVWGVVAWTLVAIPMTRGPLGHSAVREDASALLRHVQRAPLVFIIPADDPHAEPDPALLLYTGKAIPRVTVEQADQFSLEGQVFYALTVSDQQVGTAWRRVYEFESSGQQLWHTLEGRGIAHPVAEGEVADRRDWDR